MTTAAARTALGTDTLSKLRGPDEPAAATYASAKILLFTRAGRPHCASLGSVREVIPVQPATPLPGAPRHVRGLINVRGSIVTVLDAAMSEYGVLADDATASILLVERGSRVAGVVVDEVHAIARISGLGDTWESAATLASSLFLKMRQAADDAGLGTAAFVRLEADRGHVCATAKGEIVLVALTDRKINLGKLRLEMLSTTELL